MLGATPLRYPGGKTRLTGYVQSVMENNGLVDGHYVEPFAGGAGIAMSLLFLEYAGEVHLNDIDRSVYAFWHSVVNNASEFCERIESTPVTVEEWENQKAVQANRSRAKLIDLGFSTFFLNRTNRSGILAAGIIGGRGQNGKWKIDARFNKPELVARVKRIARYKDRIHLYRKDACEFLAGIAPVIPERSLVYLDPPYYVKGQDLYVNFYEHEDHAEIAEFVKNELDRPWMVSYDDVPQIRALYAGMRRREYALEYSAAERYEGKEVMFFSDHLSIPKRSRN
jgi:DNA adenine methylase